MAATDTANVAPPVSFEDQMKKLDEIVAKLEEVIPPVERRGGAGGGVVENKGEHMHGFCAHNLHFEQEKINEMFNNMVQQYQKFTQGSSTSQATAAKLTNEKLHLSNLVNPLKKTLENAMSKLRQFASDDNLKTTVMKLEAISIEEGLRFDFDPLNNQCFIQCDMFYIEAMLDSSNGQATEVILHGHDGQNKSSKQLLQILRRRDYAEFRAHLQGLKSQYMLKGHRNETKGERFYQGKILNALEAVEEDVMKLMRYDVASCNVVSDCIRSGPVGYVTPRDGGKNLQMAYLADPLLLLDLQNRGSVQVLSTEEPLPSELGFSAVLTMRHSPRTILPISSLVVNENNSVHYTKQDLKNSEEVPACYVLKLSKPLPASVHTTRFINKLINKCDTFAHSSRANLDDLILHQFLGVARDKWIHEEFVVDLPEQRQIFTCVASEDTENVGLLLSAIPFTHPIQLPALIKLLRYQAMYNLLLTSCVHNSIDDNNSNNNNNNNNNNTSADTQQQQQQQEEHMFRVIAASWNTLTVTFLHPIDGSIASVDFILSTDCYIECCLNTMPGSPAFTTGTYMNKVVNRCLSIPITMRSILKQAETYQPDAEEADMLKKEKKAIRPVKLQMPSLAQIQSEMPLMSPHLLSSPSTFLNFSPNATLFMSEQQQKSISKKRPIGTTTPLGTPNSDGSRTPNTKKLPVIKLKRKKVEDSEVYEIEQKTSSTEFSSDIVNTPPVEKTNEFPFTYPPTTATSTVTTPSTPTPAVVTTDPKTPVFQEGFAGPAAGGVGGGVGIEGEGELEGILGIHSDAFTNGNGGDGNGNVNGNIAGFDLDAMSSGRDVSFDAIPSGIIDPAALVKSPADSFDIATGAGMIDIDSLINT